MKYERTGTVSNESLNPSTMIFLVVLMDFFFLLSLLHKQQYISQVSNKVSGLKRESTTAFHRIDSWLSQVNSNTCQSYYKPERIVKWEGHYELMKKDIIST